MSASTIPDGVEPVEELWVCAGLDLDTATKQFMTWLRDEGRGKRVWYAITSKTERSAVVGAIYRVRVSRWTDEKGVLRTVRHGEPQFVRRWEDTAARAELEAVDQANRRLLELRRQEARVRADPALQEALAPLKVIAHKMINHTQRDAFVAMVMRELYNA